MRAEFFAVAVAELARPDIVQKFSNFQNVDPEIKPLSMIMIIIAVIILTQCRVRLFSSLLLNGKSLVPTPEMPAISVGLDSR